MDKILTAEQAINVAKKINSQGFKIVLAGGCFDILHIGHIRFLKKAKDQGDILFVLLEHDETIKNLKGPNRPINTQQDRSEILSQLTIVNFVVVLPAVFDNKTYDDLVIAIKPAIIATTTGDTGRIHKKRQAKLVGAKVINVTDQISNKSTTRLINILNELQ